jgi:hypothetical protein
MNPGHLFPRLVTPMLALGVAFTILVSGPQSASAQKITVTAPFSFSIDNQQYPAGTYRFTLISGWLLCMHNADGKENFFPVRPEGSGPFGSRAGLTFRNSRGHNNLLAVYIPDLHMTAVLIEPKRTEEMK